MTSTTPATVRSVRQYGTETNRVVDARSWGTTDRLGREIGSKVTTYEHETREFVQGTDTSYCHLPVGRHFGVITQTTRNGQRHQASRSADYPTAEARDAALAKHWRDVEKRARDPKAATKA